LPDTPSWKKGTMNTHHRIDPADLHLPPTAPIDITDLVVLGVGVTNDEERSRSLRR